jgi:hypothetical protein
MQCQPERSAPMHFLPSFFHWVKPMSSGTRSLGFSNSQMRPSPRNGNTCRIIPLHAPSRHGGVIHHPKLLSWVDSLSPVDAAARGSFFALSIVEAHKLVEKMTSNQS